MLEGAVSTPPLLFCTSLIGSGEWRRPPSKDLLKSKQKSKVNGLWEIILHYRHLSKKTCRRKHSSAIHFRTDTKYHIEKRTLLPNLVYRIGEFASIFFSVWELLPPGLVVLSTFRSSTQVIRSRTNLGGCKRTNPQFSQSGKLRTRKPQEMEG